MAGNLDKQNRKVGIFLISFVNLKKISRRGGYEKKKKQIDANIKFIITITKVTNE